MNNRPLLPKALAFACAVAIFQSRIFAHAFLDHAEPKVGSKSSHSPTEIKIWFTEEIEPSFSSIQVFNSDGKQVDLKDTQADEKDKTLLTVSVPALASGKYKVHWHVVASDTHKTQGDFNFEVTP